MHADHPTYKPSVFYFRRSLREAESRERAITVALIVAAEYEQLRTWASEQGVIPSVDVAAAAALLRESIRMSGSRDQAVLLGLSLCHELEQLKATVRDFGLIPPKWIVAPEEAADKGWRAKSTGTSDEL